MCCELLIHKGLLLKRRLLLCKIICFIDTCRKHSQIQCMPFRTVENFTEMLLMFNKKKKKKL